MCAHIKQKPSLMDLLRRSCEVAVVFFAADIPSTIVFAVSKGLDLNVALHNNGDD